MISFQGEYIYYRLHPDLYSLHQAEIVQIKETEPEYIGGRSGYVYYVYTLVKVDGEYYDVTHKVGDKVGEQITIAINNSNKNKYTRNEYLFWSYNNDGNHFEPTILFAAICLYIVWLCFLIREKSSVVYNYEEPLKDSDIRISNLEQAVVHNKKENKNYIRLAKKFYSVLQKPLTDELSWIFRWSDLSQFDDSFLFEEDAGNYALVEETLKLRMLGLPDDYVVFRKLGDTYYAVCFGDEKVLYLGVVYLRIQLMVRGIKFCKYIKFGEILYADVIYLQTWSGRPSKAQIEYEYVYGGNKYVAKDICRYNERDFLKLDFHEQVIRPDNAQIPIVIYKQKSLAFFQYIGIYEDLYFGKAFHFGSI